MRRLRLALLAAVALVAVGCGGGSTPHHTAPAPATTATTPAALAPSTQQTCAERHRMGECVAVAFGYKRGAGPKLELQQRTSSTNTFGTDTSQWQGWEPNIRGEAFTIIQANYGTREEPSAVTQMRNAAFDGVKVGCYSFGEPGVSGAATARVANGICTVKRGRVAGLYFDAELDGTYEHECEYVNEAFHLGVRIAGKYSAPGIDQGHRCAGFLWPAEWGSAPYAYGGYPFSDVLLYQYCGNCHIGSVEFDFDRSLRLVQMINPPKPPTPTTRRAKEHQALQRAYHLRAVLVELERKYKCPHGHPRKCRAWRGALAGQQHTIKALHTKGIW